MNDLATSIIRHVPGAGTCARFLGVQWRKYLFRNMSPGEIFSHLYKTNAWGDPESKSGPGSNSAQTDVVVKELSALLKELSISKMLDIPCGDFAWMNRVDLNGVIYHGADIVPEVVEANKRFEGPNISFSQMDIVRSRLPKADLILVRDCFIHFRNSDIFRSLRNICNSSTPYLLTTTFTMREKNVDIPTGCWRPVNLQIPPFNFPDPLMLINEGCTDGDLLFGLHRDKCLGLWRIDDVKKGLITQDAKSY